MTMPDFPTPADRACANAIAQALTHRFGHLRLSVRYAAARAAMGLAQFDAEAREERFRAWLAAGEPTKEGP